MTEVAPGMSKIFVRYRNTKPSEDEMREIFSKHGTITDVKLYAKFCFIEYDCETAAEVAVAAENGTVFKNVALEVETVFRNVQKRKPDETVAEASPLIEVAASTWEKAPSAECAVKKLKQEVLPPVVPTEDWSANQAIEVTTAIAAENVQGDEECQVQAEESKDVSKSNKAPRLEEDLPQLSQTRRRHRYRRHKPQAKKPDSVLIDLILPLRQSLSPETHLHPKRSSLSPHGSFLRSKSKDRYAELSSEDKLSSAHAHCSSSASRSHSDQPLSSYDPIPVYPDYMPNSLSPVNSRQYSSTIYNRPVYPATEQTYTTAYPHADSRSYSSNYTAECSQVNACRPGTSYYGSHENTDVRSLKQADKAGLMQSHRPWNDAHIIQEGYSVRGDPSSLGKGDRPHLSDLINYSSVHSVAKSSTSDLKARESRDPGYGSSLESYKTSLSRGATSSAPVVTSAAESQGHERSDSAAIEYSGICELIIMEPNLRQYGLKVASKIHSTGLKVEICDLPHGMTIMEEVEDALIRGRLFAVVITERHVEHNSVTVDVLHGVAEEHRNMVLDDAVRLIANSYQDYLAAKQTSAKSSAVSESSKDIADVVLDERTQMLITLLARNQHLAYEELGEIIIYLRKRQEALRKESSVLGALPGRNTAPQQEEESADVKLQRNLEATIFSILKGEAPVQQQATGSRPTHPGSYLPPRHSVESGEPYASNDYRRY